MPTLADVGPSAAAALGVPGFDDALKLGQSRHVVVCLVDGLGWTLLQRHRDLAPTLAAMSGGPIDACFPTTTPVGLGSFGTGLAPGEHGLVGASFLLPETERVLSPLQWGSDPNPIAVQPEPTVFETLQRAGIQVATVAPEAYRASGLTRAVLRGGAYRGADDIDSRVSAVELITAGDAPTFTYVYWQALDRVGHEFGLASDRWLTALADVETLVRRLVASLGPGATLVVTADHGMVDCPDDRRFLIDADRDLSRDVRHVAGEPRARHLYVRDGAAGDVQAAWRERLAGHVEALTRAEVVERGYLGVVDVALADRIGDVVAIARGDAMFASSADARVSSLRGQHGALTDDERLIPALVHRR